jgi:hypothetical protein
MNDNTRPACGATRKFVAVQRVRQLSGKARGRDRAALPQESSTGRPAPVPASRLAGKSVQTTETTSSIVARDTCNGAPVPRKVISISVTSSAHLSLISQWDLSPGQVPGQRLNKGPPRQGPPLARLGRHWRCSNSFRKSEGQLTYAGGAAGTVPDPTEKLPIDYCALRGPDLYAILYEDRRALCLARAEQDDRRRWGLLAHATTSGMRFEQKRREVLAHFSNHQLGRAQRWPRAGH